MKNNLYFINQLKYVAGFQLQIIAITRIEIEGFLTNVLTKPSLEAGCQCSIRNIPFIADRKGAQHNNGHRIIA